MDNLEDIILNEISHIQEGNYCIINDLGKCIYLESNLKVTGDFGQGKMGSYNLMSILSIWSDEKFWK